MALTVGSRLGHYAVTALTGEGGMGQVYQATDTKLNRQVALKILPEAFAADPDRLARFEREAQVLASLNHPGIAAIYGIEDEDTEGTKALVLELVEGPTLADRIAKGPIPVDEAIPIATQIAEALEAAHEAGVIHRDLKPANIKAREDGTVKVLDFGLAKAFDIAPEGDPSQSPTLTAAATQMGVVMGTAAYMSPEQARGKPVDKRADIWAFGCVLYELLSGRRAFAGDNITDVLAHVIEREPRWTDIPAGVPPALRSFLKAALQKNPTERLRDAGDLGLVLRGVFDSEPGSLSGPSSARQVLMTLPMALAMSVLAAASVWVLVRPAPAGPIPPTTFAVSSPLGFPVLPQVAPDGRAVAFTVVGPQGRVYLKSMDALEPEPVRGTEATYVSGYSPDGEWLLVGDLPGSQSPRMLKRVPRAGGVAVPIAPGGGRSASWGPDDTIVFGSFAGLRSVSASGGEVSELTALSDGEVSHFFPRFLPSGRAVLFQVWTGDRETAQVAVYDLDSGQHRSLFLGMSPQYVTTGHLIFWRYGALWVVPFDQESLSVTGDPVVVVEDVAAQFDGFGHYSVSQAGTLAYVPTPRVGRERALVWVDRQGSELSFTSERRPFGALQISPDGLALVVEVEGASTPEGLGLAETEGNSDVWTFDLASTASTRLTFDPAADRSPIWTPDGARVIFGSSRDGDIRNLFSKSADGSGRVERVTTSPYPQTPSSFTPDGRVLVLSNGQQGLEGFSTTEGLGDDDLLGDEAGYDGTISPDGKWLAYVSRASGQPEVHVRPFPDTAAGHWPISTGIGVSPVWGPDSDELFYQVLEGPERLVKLMSVAVQPGSSFRYGAPVELFEGRYRSQFRSFDTHDGQRFLMVKEESGTDVAQVPIVVVQHWHEALKSVVPFD